MGIIDTVKFTITCPKCGVMEYVSVHQKGSIYSPYWQNCAKAKSFDLNFVVGNKEEPKITSAKCKECGSEAIF